MKVKYWLVLGAVLLLTSAAMAASVKIITQRAMIRKDKRFFAPVVFSVPYGEVIQQLKREGDWLLVVYRNKQGWVHISAVQEQKFRLSSLMSTKARQTSQDEVALAGKGFSPEIEKVFRQQNPEMKFHLVDQVESLTISSRELQNFVKKGRLKEPGGEL